MKNSSTIKVRFATEADILDICKIMLSTDPYTTLGYTNDMCHDIVLSAIEKGWALVAEVNGKIVGFILFRVFDGFSLGGYIRALAVDKEYRRKGVATALMDKAEQIVFKYRRNVFLLVSSFNQIAIKFYLSRGYQRIGEIKDAIVKGYSEIIMRKTRRSWNNYRK